ncbi:MAG: esterase/lipase family protein [Micromonosporaceae bacterium]
MSLRATSRFAALSPRRRALVAGSILIAVALLIIGGIRVAQRMGGTAKRHAGSGPPAVVLVPGYGGNTRSLDLLEDRIRRTGATATIVPLPSGGTGDLEVQADVLNGYVDRAIQRGARWVDVIGYSAGGVVARVWDVEHDGASKARRIVTLGSPLHGAELAAAGAAVDPAACPPACQQLVPGSSLLTRLERVPFAGRPAWLSLWTVDDVVVQPPDSARLSGAMNVPLQSVCPDAIIQHGQLPSDPLVVGIVLRALGPAPLTAPRASQCTSLRALGSTSAQ